MKLILSQKQVIITKFSWIKLKSDKFKNILNKSDNNSNMLSLNMCHKQRLKIKHFSLIFFLTICMSMIVSEAITFQQLSVSADSYIINSVTNYNIFYDRTQENYGIAIDVTSHPVPADSTMTLNVPSVYSINTSIGLSVIVNGGIIQFPNYTITSNTINIIGLFPSQTIVYNVTVTLNNVLNPSPAITTDPFTGTIGGDYAEPIYLKSVVVLQPAQFQSCFMTFNPKFVNRTSAMIVTIKTTTLTPFNGFFQIVFPSNIWSEGAVTSTTNYLPISSSMSCSNLSTNVKSTLQCNGTQNQNKITVSNLFTTDLTAGQTISFQINNFLSPPTNKPADLIRITSTDSLSNRINVCSQYVTDLIPNQLLSSKITITNGGLPLTVNQQYTIRFMFETVDAFALSDYFEIEFPSGSLFNFNSNLLTGGITLLRNTATYSSNVLRCYMNTLLSVKNYTSPFTMYISAGTYTAPPSIQPTASFKISVLRNGYPMQVGYQSLTPVPTTLTGSLTGRGTDVINKVTTYTLNVTISDGLSSSGKLRIRFPSQVSFNGIVTASCAQLIGTSMTDFPICTVNPTSKTIELTSINSSSSLIPSQTFTIIFTNITNPFSTALTSSFQVRSFYRSTDSSLVAVGTVSGFSSKQAIIDASNIGVTASSYKVLDQSVSYQLKYTVDNDIDLGGSLQIFVPKPIIVNTAVLSSNCKRGVNTLTTTTTPCTLVSQDGTGYIIKFTSPLSSISLPKGQFIILELSNIITNPPSTSPVSTFKLYSYSSSNALIAKIQSSISIQMTDPTSLTTASYTRDSSRNYQLTNYQFTIKQHAALEVQSVVLIQFPNQILPNVSSLCGMTLPYVNSSLNCSLVNQSSIKITLPSTSPISPDTALTLTVSNIRNPTSYRPPGDFLIRAFTSNQTYKYAQGLTSNKIANNIPSSFALISGSFTSGFLDTDISLSVSFTPAFQAPGYLQLSIPSYFTVPSALSCSQVANFNGTCQTISSHTIQIQGTFTSNGMITFQINGFRSTIRPPTSTQYVILTSFTTDNYQLDYSPNIVSFNLACDLPCRTCDTVNKSMCLSCYSNSLITDKVNYDNVTNSCYSQCPDGKYQDGVTFLCQSCDLNCATCQGSATFCTTCNQSTSNKYLNVISTTAQQCVSQCQQMMYPDLTRTPATCVNCQSPCKTCTSLSFCLTCLDTYYFWQNTCTRTCPLGITVGDNTTGKCQLCNVNCLTCQLTVDTCTSCNSSLILYNKKCLTACVSPLVYRPEISTCGPCDPQCKTCQNIGSNCTSCDPLSLYTYFFNSTCLQSCPDLYYQSVGTCALCSSLNINCDYCINSTYCDKCNTGFVFFNGQCLSSTPVGYVNISGFAQPCSGDCATCINTQSTCTSCKTLNLFGNICQSTCPSGYIPLNNTCTQCQSPCLTCSENVNNCTSCIPNLNPKVFYIDNRCQSSCPTFYYADIATTRCQTCQAPCLQCSDQVTCSSCIDSYFLYQQRTCLSACPLQFVGINKICEACLPPCKTCIDSPTKCLTCQSSYFYLAATNQCLLECGVGLYEEYLNQTCIACTQPCKTCVNTTSTCLSCLTGILYNNICLTQCPMKMYNDTNTCQSCPDVCSSCTSQTNCLSCTSPYILYNNYCINQCPATHAVILNNTCTQCSTTNCHKCYDNDVCFNCVSDYSLLNGACLSTCPVDYKTNGTHCNEVLAQSLESTGNMFPVPLSIATAVVLVACMMSKLQNQRTFLAGAVYSLVGIIQTLALIYYIYLYYVNSFYPEFPIGMYVALGSLGLLYLLNLLSIIQSIVLCYDKRFCSWRDGSILNKLYNMFTTIISILISHKFKNLMFSRLFAFHIFSAQLEDVRKFKILNIYSFISLIHSGGCIFSVITIIKLVDVKTQFFYACLDLLIVVGLNIVVAFFNAFKSTDYFDQTTPEGYLLGKKIFADEDSYNAKVSQAGNDMQNEQGRGYYSKIQHALASNQAFKFKETDQSRQDLNSQYSDSLTHVIEKQYEDVSVQAYDILNDRQPSNNRINFSTLKIQNDNGDNSKFTTIFSHNEDKSIQNTISYDKYEKGKKVDYSVQKYSDIVVVNRSMQGTIQEGNKNDMSIQYSDDGAKMQRDVSIQGSINPYHKRNDISVQGTIDYVDQSGQHSMMHSQKGVQKTMNFNDRSIQPTIQYNEWNGQNTIDAKQWNGQNTIDLKQISIQKSQDDLQYYQLDETLQQQNQNDDTLLKNAGENNIFYIDEDMQENQDYGVQILPKKVDQNKKTIARQQIPEQKQDAFDLPPDEFISYQQELQSKIQQKQKQLERVRKEIQLKEKQSILKQQIMRAEKEKIEKQLKSKQENQQREKNERQANEKRLKEQQQRMRKQLQERKINNLKALQEARKQAEIQKEKAQKAIEQAQKAKRQVQEAKQQAQRGKQQRQKERMLEQVQRMKRQEQIKRSKQEEQRKKVQVQEQNERVKIQESVVEINIEDEVVQVVQVAERRQQQQEDNNKKEQQTKKEEPRRVRQLIQQMDLATSIDHSQLQTPHFEAYHLLGIAVQDVQQLEQKKQEKLQVIQTIQQQDEDNQLDEEEQFLNGEIVYGRRRKNFQVDVNRIIKVKGQKNVDKDIDSLSGDEDDLLDDQSVKTINKIHPNHEKHKIKSKIQSINKEQQANSTKQPSLPLGAQQQSPFVDITINNQRKNQPIFDQQNILPSPQYKQPGKIRVIQQPQTNNMIIQFEQDELEEQHYQKTKDFLYQQEDLSLKQDNQFREEDEIEFRQNNQSNILTNRHKRKHQNIGKLNNLNQITNNNYHSQQINHNNYHSQQTSSYRDKQIIQQSINQSPKDHQLPEQQLVYQQHDQSLQQFDSSQDIPFQFKHKNTTQSDVQDYHLHRNKNSQQAILHKQQQMNFITSQQKQLLDHQQLMRSFNNSRKNLSNKKPILPPQSNNQPLHVNLNKLQSYHIDKPNNGKQSSKQLISHDKKPNSSSGSLLANAARNIISNDVQNQKLKRKLSSQKNPLMTQQKWEYSQPNPLNSIQQQTQSANDSFVGRNNRRQNSNIKNKPPVPPTQTDKQQTSFSHLRQKVGSQTQNPSNQKIRNIASSKSFNTNNELQRGKSKKSVNNFGQQVEVYFEKKEENHQYQNEKPDIVRPSKTNQLPVRLVQPSTTNVTNQGQSFITTPLKPSYSRQFESQEIFADQFTPKSDEQYSEGQTQFNPSISKKHRNNLILDKMMQRPDNDDLYEYYNRASTQRGKSNKKRSTEKKNQSNTKINLSKQKYENDRNLQKIYMQRLDGSHAQMPRSKSRGRY